MPEDEFETLRERHSLRRTTVGLHRLKVDLEAAERAVIRNGAHQRHAARRQPDDGRDRGKHEQIASQLRVDGSLLEADEE
jgi:hypothetical protein